MKIKNILLPALLLFTAAITAQNPAIEEKPYIEVNGNGEMEVVPDEIYVSITIRERSTNKKTISVEEQEQNLKTALKSLKVDLKNLSVSGANADFVRVDWRKKGVITEKQYSLRLSNATVLGQVFTELDKLEITDSYVSHVQHSKIDSLRKVVKIMAIKAAKNKADYLLAAIGEKTGKVLIVRENDAAYYPQPIWANVRKSEDYNSGSEPPADPIDFKKIKVESSIYAKFGIQ